MNCRIYCSSVIQKEVSQKTICQKISLKEPLPQIEGQHTFNRNTDTVHDRNLQTVTSGGRMHLTVPDNFKQRSNDFQEFN